MLPRSGSRRRALWRRVVRFCAILIPALLVLNTATQNATAAQLTPGRLPSLSALLRSVEHLVDDSSAAFDLPSQAAGVAGRGGAASAASTRADRGTGSAPRAGAHQLPAYAPYQGKATKGLSGAGANGTFNAATSKFVGSKSSATLSWYQNADGSITKRVSQSPVNYQVSPGVWAPVNGALVRSGSGRYAEKANSLGISFAANSGPGAASRADSDTGSSVPDSTASASASGSASPTTSASASASASPSASASTSASGSPTGSAAPTQGDSDSGDLAQIAISPTQSVGWSLDGAADVDAAVSGNTATYSDIRPSTTVQEQGGSTGDKESIVLASAAAGNSWTFALNTVGLTPSINSEGQVVFTDAAGTEEGYIPLAYASDSDVNPVTGSPATTWDVKYGVVADGAGWDLTVTVDKSWLDSSARVFPVKVDPSFIVSIVGDNATTYTESGDSGDYSSATHMPSGYCPALNCGTAQSAISLISLPTFPSDEGYYATSASLSLYDTWTAVSVGSAACTAANEPNFSWSTIDVSAISTAWSVTGEKTYPWVSYGSPIGTAAPATLDACQNTAGNLADGDWVTIPFSNLAPINAWSFNSSPNYGLAVYGPSSSLSWRQYDTDLESNYTPYLSVTYSDQAPQITGEYPDNGYSAPTLTPELVATAARPSGSTTSTALTYDFTVTNSSGATVVSSGDIANGDWTVPSGDLTWGQTYYWTVTSSDGTLTSVAPPTRSIDIAVPQPAITSELSQNDGDGYDASTGNYTTEATDASVSVVGPSLSVVRDYNSVDPRTTGAFGASWSSELDAKAVPQYNSAGKIISVTVTYPDGEEVGFGLNANGTYSPPSGRYATLTTLSGGGYMLTDKDDTEYSFGESLGSGAYGITFVTDSNKRVLEYIWSGGLITTVTSETAGRSLHLQWNAASGTTAAHVNRVFTDPVTGTNQNTDQTWLYWYSGNELTGVCDPDMSGCTGAGAANGATTTYTYQSGNLYQEAALDDGAQSYWPLSEHAGSSAASAVTSNEGADDATYSNVTLGTAAGPFTGSAATASTFNGTSSSVQLPSSLLLNLSYLSMSLWFKTTTSGPLWCEQNGALGSTPTNATCSLYVGTDGYIHGAFYTGVNTGINGTKKVTDGTWHHVVLSAAGTTESLYLDGALVGTLSGQVNNLAMSYGYVGAGYNSGDWADTPTTKGTDYFNGSIADVGFFSKPLQQADVTGLYQAGESSAAWLTSITTGAGHTTAQVSYDGETGRVTKVVDENGGTYNLYNPTVVGTSGSYQSSVLGAGPFAYYPLNDTAGAANAESVEKYPAGTYSNVTLGAAGPFSDQSAATFNGTSSYVQLPSNSVNTLTTGSVSLWFNTKTPGGVLLSTSLSALSAGTTTGDYTPMLYVGTDGMLHGEFWTGGASPINGTTAVDDGKWHQVVLTGTPSGEVLYLDGVQIGTLSSGINEAQTVPQSNVYLGAGFTGGSWLNNAYYEQDGDDGFTQYYNGSIAQLSLYRSSLSATQVANQYAAYESSSSGVSPTQVSEVAGPDSSQVSIPMTGQTYAASAGQSWTGETTKLTFGSNGNLVLSRLDTGATVWSSNTSGNTSATLQLLTNGNLAVYNGTTILWQSGTSNSAGNSMLLRADGNLEIDSSAGHQRWATNVTLPYATGVLYYKYDMLNDLRMMSQTDGRGDTTSYGYDTNGFLYTVTDPNGDVTTTGHDVRGNIVSETTCQNQSTDACSTSYYTYYPDDTTPVLTAPSPENDQVLTERGDGSASATDNTYLTTNAYNAAGNLSSSTDPLNRTSTISYTDGTSILAYGSTTLYAPAGLPYQTKDSSGAVTTYEYYTDGDLAETISPLGETTVMTYDNVGRALTKTIGYQTSLAGTSTSETETTTYTYNGEGQVLTETDPVVSNAVTGDCHEALTTNVYDVDQNLTSQIVSDAAPSGCSGGTGDTARTQTYTYNAYDELASETDPDNDTSYYTYDAFGDKVSDTDPDGITTDYAYDPDNNLLTTTVAGYTGSPSGSQPATNLVTEARTYDPAGRLASITDGMGVATDYTYTDNGLLATETRVSTVAGDAGSYVDESDSYDPAGDLTSQVTRNGALTTNYVYDDGGRVTSEVDDPTGLDRTTTFSYDAQNNVTNSETYDANSTVANISYTYDASGNKLTQSVADGSTNLTTSYSYDQRGMETSEKDPDGNSTYYAYDSAGQLYETVAPAVASTTYSTATGTASTVTAHPTTWTGYDTFGDVAEELDPNGNETQYYYDAAGQKTAEISPSYTAPGASSPTVEETAYQYDGDGNLVKDTDDGLGASETYAYDQLGDKTSETDFDNDTTNFTYDADGDLLSTTDPTGAVTSETYDFSNRPVTETRADRYTGANDNTAATYTANLAYDAAGDLASETTAAGVKTSYGYDAEGEQTSVTDGANNTTTYGYDAEGRVVKTTNPDGTSSTAAYDEAGNEVGTADFNASGTQLRSTSATFDGDGDELSGTNADGFTTSYGYDATGMVTSETQPVTSTSSIGISFGYDLAGNRTSYTDGNGNTDYTTYNSWNLKESSVLPSTSAYTSAADLTTTTGYDADGRVSQVVLPGGVTQNYTYDDDDDVLTESGSGATGTTATRSFTYDADGRVLTAATSNTLSGQGSGQSTASGSTAPSGSGSATGSPSPGSSTGTATGTSTAIATGTATATGTSTSTSTSTATGTATGSSTPSPTSPTSSLPTATSAAATAPSAGSTTAGSASNATSEQFSYNDRGDLLTATGSAGNSSFTYSPDDLMASRTDSSGTTTYSYDDDDRLSVQNDAYAGSMTYGYNDDSELTSISYGGGDVMSYGYDPLGRRTSETLDSSTGQQVGAIDYGYDNDDNVTSQTTYGIDAASGTASNANSYAYDEAGRLTSWTSTPSSTGTASTTNYTYDNDGNLLTKGSTGYTYNAQDELVTQSAGTATTNYSYAADGDMTEADSTGTGGTGAENFTTDAFGAQVTAGGEQYTVDALGRIVAQTDAATGQVTDSLTYSGTGDEVASDSGESYSRGPDGTITGYEAAGVNSPQAAWTDSHGDLTGYFLANSPYLSGWVVYDPWGTRTTTGGGWQPQVGFQGAWTDPTTGLVDMGSRFYDPGTGSFDDRDSVWTSLDDADSIDQGDAYAYVLDNPETGTDPLGDCWICSVFHSVVHHVAKVVHKVVRVAKAVVKAVVHIAKKTVRVVARAVSTVVHEVRDAAVHVYHAVRRVYRDTYHAVATAYHRVKRVVKAAAHYVEKHAAAVVNKVKKEYTEHKKAIEKALKVVSKVAGKIAVVASVVAAAAPVLNVIAAVTAEVPILDVVTSGLAATSDAAGEIAELAQDVSLEAGETADAMSGDYEGMAGDMAMSAMGGMGGAGEDAADGTSMRAVDGDAGAGDGSPDPGYDVEVTIDKANHPQSGQHIEDAQAAGKPDVLTIARGGAKANRAASLKGLKKVPGMQLDEYPPAMFSEGGAGASVRAIDSADNGGAGARMGNLLRSYDDGTRVKITVVDTR